MNATNDQMYSFFRRNADPGGLYQDHGGIPPPCGSYCGLYRVSTTDTAAIPTCSSRTNSFSRSYRNVALGEKVSKACVTPSGTHKIFFKGSTTLPLYESGTSEFHTFRPALNGHKKHKRIRRGKRGKSKTIGKSANQPCNIYYANVNGFRSKSESIKQLIQEKAIDILILTETKIYTKSAIQLDGFQMFPVVKGKSGGGGLFIAVKHDICSSIMVDEGENAEFATVKMEFGNICFRFLVVYGPQEGDHIHQINDLYENLFLQIERASVAGDPILMVGDFNAKLGKGIIKDDINDMSSNGQKLHNLIIKYNLNVVNSMEIFSGTFTRANNKIVGE